MEAGAGEDYDGFYLECLAHAAADPPAVIRNCVVAGGNLREYCVN